MGANEKFSLLLWLPSHIRKNTWKEKWSWKFAWFLHDTWNWSDFKLYYFFWPFSKKRRVNCSFTSFSAFFNFWASPIFHHSHKHHNRDFWLFFKTHFAEHHWSIFVLLHTSLFTFFFHWKTPFRKHHYHILMRWDN